MHGTFKLTIALGNDAMRTADDVAEALVRTAARLRSGYESASIHAANGNPVGSFVLDGAPDEQDVGAYHDGDAERDEPIGGPGGD